MVSGAPVLLPLEVLHPMKRPFAEKYSFARRLAVCLVILAVTPALALAATHPLFNLQSSTQSPFPSDRFAVLDSQQITGLRVNLPLPNCGTNPSDCADITLDRRAHV